MGEFAKRLKKLRLEHQLTQEELAPELEISRSTLGMYETGKREPDFETLEVIADFFNVDMNYLIGYSDDPHDWNEIGNEQGIYPPREYEGSYEDYVKSKIYEEQDYLCDLYCDLSSSAINYLKSINCQVKNIAEIGSLMVITPSGEHLKVSEADLVYNFMIYGSSKPGIKKLVSSHNISNLRKDESLLLKKYNSLNTKGQDKVVDYAKDLSENPVYRESAPILKAAHNDNADDPEEQRLMAEDLKDMEDNW